MLYHRLQVGKTNPNFTNDFKWGEKFQTASVREPTAKQTRERRAGRRTGGGAEF